MDQEEYKKLQAETESYRSTLENVNFEKVALDRQYVKKLQEALQLEAEGLKKDSEIQKLKQEVDLLKNEIADLKAKSVVAEIGEIIDSSPVADNCL